MSASERRLPLHLIAAVMLGACASPTTTTDLGAGRVVERGALAYQAAMVGTRLLVSTELRLRFELVVRRIDGNRSTELGRVDLGPPDWDTSGLATASTGPMVWVSSRDGTVRGIDVTSMQVVHRWPVGSAVTAIAVDRSGALLAYGTSGGVLCLRRLSDGALLQCVHDTSDELSALSFAAETNQTLVSATIAGEVTTWAVPTLAIRSKLRVDGPVSALTHDAAGRLAVAIGERPGRSKIGRGEVLVVDGTAQLRCIGHRDSVTSLAWTGDGLLVSGALDGSVRLWKLAEQCESLRSRGLGQPVSSVVNPPSGAFLAVGMWAKGRKEKSVLFVPYLYPSR